MNSLWPREQRQIGAQFERMNFFIKFLKGIAKMLLAPPIVFVGTFIAIGNNDDTDYRWIKRLMEW